MYQRLRRARLIVLALGLGYAGAAAAQQAPNSPPPGGAAGAAPFVAENTAALGASQRASAQARVTRERSLLNELADGTETPVL